MTLAEFLCATSGDPVGVAPLLTRVLQSPVTGEGRQWEEPDRDHLVFGDSFES